MPITSESSPPRSMDQKLLFLINREWVHPALDWFMTLLSSWSVWTPVLAVLFITLAIRGGFRMRAFLVVATLVIGVTDGIVCKSLKSLLDKPRPHQSVAGVRQLDFAKATPRFLALGKPLKVKISDEPDRSEDVDGRSLPSSHTANTTAFSVVALYFFRRSAWWTFLIPLGVGYSRIYTGAHWPSDVAVSFVLGIIVSLGLLALLSKLWRERGSKILPRVHASHPTLSAA